MNVSLHNIHKSFGANAVLTGVNLDIAAGRVLALLGENGAGKSTLMNILGGVFPPDSGEIRLDGQTVAFKNPAASLAAGIAFIHQELSLVNDLKVYENVFLGREIRRPGGFLNRRRMLARTAELLRNLEIDIAPDAPISALDPSRKQIVEISRALLGEARVIIMDEPTTSLAEQEIVLLFRVLRALTARGVGVVFISHKLNEVVDYCDDYAVLRNGVLVGQGEVSQTSAEKLSELIVGREVRDVRTPREHPAGRPMLELKNLSREGSFTDVSLTARAGEILGVTGLLGDGRTAVMQAVFGALPDCRGEIVFDGAPLRPDSPRQAIRQGIAYLPSNRKENAIVPDLSILENGTLAMQDKYRRWGWRFRRPQLEDFLRNAQMMNLKYGAPRDLITTLSGGNQQKVVLGRWLNTPTKLLILDNPTQGVDIGAKFEIYGIIRELAAKGLAVIVLSGEGQEIVRLCHRALVMYHGRVAGELDYDRLNEQNIMKLATGATSI